MIVSQLDNPVDVFPSFSLVQKELSGLLLNIIEPDISEQVIFNRCLQFTKDLLNEVKTRPTEAFVYTSAYPLSQGSTSHLLNQLIFSIITGLRNNDNEHFIQHYSAACICLFAAHQEIKQGQIDLYRRSMIFAKRKRLGIWLDVFALRKIYVWPSMAPVLRKKALTGIQLRVVLALYFAEIDAKTSRTRPFSALLQQAYSLLKPQYRQYLDPLLDYPGMIAPRDIIKVDGKPMLVVDRNEHMLALLAVGEASEISHIPARDIERTSHNLSGQKWYQKLAQVRQDGEEVLLANQLLPHTYPVSNAPSIITKLMSLVTAEDTRVDDIVTLVETDPLLASYLKVAASKDNRLGLPVKRLKQGILTYGFERIADILMIQALTFRLNQKHFPLRELSHQFTQLASTIAHELAKLTNDVSPQKAALLTLFATSPLFIAPGLKAATELPMTVENHHAQGYLFSIDNPSVLTDYAVTLAKGWHQDDSVIATLGSSHRMPNQISKKFQQHHALLGLSLYYAKSLMFNLKPCKRTTVFVEQATKILNITDSDYQALRASLGENLFTPLTNAF